VHNLEGQPFPVRFGEGDIFSQPDRVRLEMKDPLIVFVAGLVGEGPAAPLADQQTGLLRFTEPEAPSASSGRRST
jgi:hypothetical protein